MNLMYICLKASYSCWIISSVEETHYVNHKIPIFENLEDDCRGAIMRWLYY